MGSRTATVVLGCLLGVVVTTLSPSPGPGSPAAAAPPEPAALTWQGTINASINVSNPGVPETFSSTWSWTDLTPVDSFGGYTGGVATVGQRVTQNYCSSSQADMTATYSWDYSRPKEDLGSHPTLYLTDADSGLSLILDPPGALTDKSWGCGDSEPIILANATGLRGATDFGSLPDTDPDPLRVVGSTSSSGGDDFGEWSISVDYDLTAVVCGALPGDADGDRLPDDYETSYTLSDPENCDTDGDEWYDAIEVASGSSPTSAAQTPDTLPAGGPPSSVTGRGDAGVTCGLTRFGWVTPSLDSLGVNRGKRGCVYLLSNKVTKGLVATAFSREESSISAAVMAYLQPHLSEIYGLEALDWAHEASQDASFWSGPRAPAKKAMHKAFNLARLNAVFTVGQVGALAGVPFVAQWGYRQVRDKNACLQVRIGMDSQGQANFSWSLAYSQENLTEQGFDDQLHRAGVWKRRVVDNGIDRAVKRPVNLSCVSGRVKAGGGQAGEIFSSPVSFLF